MDENAYGLKELDNIGTIGTELPTPKNIDEMLDIVGPYGRFQKTINIMFIIMAFPSAYQLMISYFTLAEPGWQCTKGNSSTCKLNGTFSHNDQSRCKYERWEWEFVTPRNYSVVTEFDLTCERGHLVEITSSSLFIGWLFGAVILGWATDNYGRKKTLFISVGSVIIFGLIEAFMRNIYAFIFCRLVVGFFLPGTFPQIMFLYISEVIGVKRRAFAGLSLFVFIGLALTTLTLFAYLVSSWKLLYVVCTAPYLFVLLFYKYVPESMRYLRIKGRTEECMEVFRLIADRNHTIIPPGICIEPPAQTKKDNVNPLDLFRSPSMASRSVIQGVGYFVSAMAFFTLYLGAEDISGHLYRDFLILSAAEIPVALLIMDFAERFGRKRTVMNTFMLGSLMSVALGFTPNNEKYKPYRILFGMVGKVSISSTCNSFQTWSVELYPTQIRGQGTGFLQVMSRLGAACAPFVNKEFNTMHDGAADIFIGIASFVAYFLLCFLPETKGNPTSDRVLEVDDDDGASTREGDEMANIGYENPIADNV